MAAITSNEQATTIARADAGRAGSMRAGFAPKDIDTTFKKYAWTEQARATGTWTEQRS